MKPVIFFRKNLVKDEEVLAAKEAGFEISFSRMPLKNNLVVSRYSALPNYKELEEDLKYNNSVLINSHFEHNYIASFDYYHDIKDFTFKTYFDFSEIESKEAPFVVKGRTNSKKLEWNTKMFALNKEDAIHIGLDLLKEDFYNSQGIVIRKFHELEVLEEGLNGLKFNNEWRFFFYKDKMLSYGFYWSGIENKGKIDQDGINLAKMIAKKVADKVNFFTIDIAKTKEGKWIVVELNDGQQSGLSDNNPNELYINLKKNL